MSTRTHLYTYLHTHQHTHIYNTDCEFFDAFEKEMHCLYILKNIKNQEKKQEDY